MAVHSTETGGVAIMLPNAMCLDRHVPDFLSCLQCWLQRTFGDPKKTLKPWRILSLDLSRNSLDDDSVIQVVETLKKSDLRLERLKLAGNCIKEKGMATITEFIWNCKDALVEIDLTDNDIVADPGGDAPGSDAVSSLLRCFYNHSAYPLLLRDSSENLQAVPIIIRLGGNFIASPAKLLKQIRTNGGRDHVQIRAAPDPYPHVDQEYLSACLPGFLTQRTTETNEPATPVETNVEAEVKAHRAETDGGKRTRSRSERNRRRRRGDGGNNVQPEEANRDGDAKRKRPVLTEEEQGRLQSHIDAKLLSLGGPPSEAGTREMLAEFAVCMVVAKKGMKEIQDELATFLGKLTATFTEWFEDHLRKDFVGVLR